MALPLEFFTKFLRLNYAKNFIGADKVYANKFYGDGSNLTGISGGNSVSAPDWSNQRMVGSNNTNTTAQGIVVTWTADADGYVQRLSTINRPSTPYATFTATVNGVTSFTTEYAGLTTTGLYSYVWHPVPVKQGDVINLSRGDQTVGSGGTMLCALTFYPPR